VLLALGIQHAMRMRHTVLCGLPDYNTSPHYLITGTIRGKKVIGNKMCFHFNCKYRPKLFHSKKN
jgi:hypothetical protein